MTGDVSGPEDQSEASPPATEVEYALILSQMIEVAERDPSQLRLAIYEFARTKLSYNTVHVGRAEREKLFVSLEAAIAGVEKFSRRGGIKRVTFENGRIELKDPARAEPALALSTAKPSRTFGEPSGPSHRIRMRKLSGLLHRVRSSEITQYWFSGAVVAFAVIVAASYFVSQSWRHNRKVTLTAQVETPSANAVKRESTGEPANIQPSDFPLPTDYGVYLVNGASLTELTALPERVPDRRIEVSTPINQVGQAASTDSDPKFVIYRRDFANEAPDRVEVRAMARVARVISFDAKGKPVFSSGPAGWIIRNTIYEFKVRPLPNHPEMLLVQPKQSDLLLPPGRYVLTIKERGFDFTIPGDVTDPTQCVERTDAANGSFYSDCRAR